MRINIIILGGAGVGKSSLDGLLRPDVKTLEPYRARESGARAGERTYVSPEMLEELYRLYTRCKDGSLLEVDSNEHGVEPFVVGGRSFRKWLVMFPEASFFLVRNTKQVLLHQLWESADHWKIEIFAPILSLMLTSEIAVRAIPVLDMADKTIFLLLNPHATPTRSLGPAGIIASQSWTRGDWETLQAKRYELKSQKPDLSEINTRIDMLPAEAVAWQEFQHLAQRDPSRYGFIEICGWQHFEYKHMQNPDSEREATRDAILNAARGAGLTKEVAEFIAIPGVANSL